MARKGGKRRRPPHSLRKTQSVQAAGSPWILSPLVDSLLFIGAPLLCMAVFLPMRTLFSSRQIAVFLLAFFTFGHHLPGFFRAYGDRELFERYRLRFLLAPPILFAAALWFKNQDLHGLLVFLSAWDIWHVLMQQYGFMRIYDAKEGAVDAVTSWLDWAVSISWYLTLIATSPHYLHSLLRVSYYTGLPILPPELVSGAKTAMVLCSLGLSIVYVGHHVNRWRKGLPISVRKIVMLAIFLAATYTLYVYLDDFLVGFTVWSAFHCIQYYGIVWAFNRNRVDRKAAVTRFVRFLFRPRAGLVVLYAFLILAYGSLNYWPGFLDDQSVVRLLLAFVFTSNALHYYYDGFIWKVREADTRTNLNIADRQGASEETPSGWRTAPAQWLSRVQPGLAQFAYLAIIVVFLAGLEVWKPNDPVAAYRSLAATAPEVGVARFRLGEALEARGALDEALEEYRQAARLLPDSWQPRNNAAGILAWSGRIDEAIEQYRDAIRLIDRSRSAKGGLTDWSTLAATLQISGEGAHTDPSHIVYVNLGDLLADKGDFTEALLLYRKALRAEPQSVRAQTNLGTTLAQMGRPAEARAELEKALQWDGSYAYAHFNLGLVLAALGDEEGALFHFQAALQYGDESQQRAARAAVQNLLRQRRVRQSRD